MKLILVVDNDDQVRTVITKTLERHGYVVRQAVDGDEASRFLQEIVPHLIITDLIMPEKGGLELISEIGRDHPDTRIIAISGMTKADPEFNLNMASALGADYVLAKPFTAKELLAAVEKVFGTSPLPTE
jgi:CheY-like chemotaxis protein